MPGQTPDRYHLHISWRNNDIAMQFDFSKALCIRLCPTKWSRELSMIAKSWGIQALGLVHGIIGAYCRQYP